MTKLDSLASLWQEIGSRRTFRSANFHEQGTYNNPYRDNPYVNPYANPYANPYGNRDLSPPALEPRHMLSASSEQHNSSSNSSRASHGNNQRGFSPGNNFRNDYRNNFQSDNRQQLTSQSHWQRSQQDPILDQEQGYKPQGNEEERLELPHDDLNQPTAHFAHFTSTVHKCRNCDNEFPSRTQLFLHLKKKICQPRKEAAQFNKASTEAQPSTIIPEPRSVSPITSHAFIATPNISQDDATELKVSLTDDPPKAQTLDARATTLPNRTTVFRPPEVAAAYRKRINEFDIWTDKGFVKLDQEEWMKRKHTKIR